MNSVGRHPHREPVRRHVRANHGLHYMGDLDFNDGVLALRRRKRWSGNPRLGGDVRGAHAWAL